MILLPCLFQTPRGIWFLARFERRAAMVVPSIKAICASGTLSPVMPSLSCSAADIAISRRLQLAAIDDVHGWRWLQRRARPR